VKTVRPLTEEGERLAQGLKVKFAGVSYELAVSILTVPSPKGILAELFQLQKDSVKLSCKGKMIEPDSIKPGDTVMLLGQRTAAKDAPAASSSANVSQTLANTWSNWMPRLWSLLMGTLNVVWLFFTSFFEPGDPRDRRRDSYNPDGSVGNPDHVVDPNRPFDPEGRRAAPPSRRSAQQEGFAAPGDTERPEIERTE
jgi:hypothetical protein